MANCSDSVKTGDTPPDECLALAAHHVAHDLELFELAWNERHSRLGWTLWFILARSQMDFFFRFERKKDDDDILAVDFPAKKPWKPLAESLLKTADQVADYKAVRTAANKNSAHLTYSRTDEDSPGKVGPSAPVHRFLQGVRRAWFERLEPSARVWFGISV
jgi:hypothetical protein